MRSCEAVGLRREKSLFWFLRVPPKAFALSLIEMESHKI
jgi:hypothetical protein